MEKDLNMNQKQLDMLSKMAKKKTGLDVNEMKQSIENGSIDQFLNKNMSADAAEQLKRVLTDKKVAEQMLNTPEARELMKKLLGK